MSRVKLSCRQVQVKAREEKRTHGHDDPFLNMAHTIEQNPYRRYRYSYRQHLADPTSSTGQDSGEQEVTYVIK